VEHKGCHDSQADQYDIKVHENLDDYVRENYFTILSRVVELTEPSHGLSILDIGIGTGLLTERFPEGLSLYGVDVSERMMDKIREKGLNVHLSKGDFCDIPFPAGHFDRVVSTFAFHHLTPAEKVAAFKEIDRVLNNHGVLVIGDFMFEDENQRNQLVQKFLHEGRSDMVEEIEDEYFTYLDEASTTLNELGYLVTYERGSTISWILKAQKESSRNK